MLWYIRKPWLIRSFIRQLPLAFIERSDGDPARMIDSALTQSFVNHLLPRMLLTNSDSLARTDSDEEFVFLEDPRNGISRLC